MKEVFGNAMVLRKDYTYLAVTTNGFVKKNGSAVMGAGIAKAVANEDPKAPAILGLKIKTNGNIVQKIYSNVISFPVKHNWYEEADIELIKKSCIQLMKLIGPEDMVLLPRPGCGNRKLKWEEVKPIIEPLLDDRVSVVHWIK